MSEGKNQITKYKIYVVITISMLCIVLAAIYRIENEKRYDNNLYNHINEEYKAYEENHVLEDVNKINNYFSNYNKDKYIIGKIQIEKINLEYPILRETTDELMKIAPTYYEGPNINGIGNLVIIGHNFYDGTQFSNLYKLKTGDTITLTDLHNKSVTYIVFEKKIILPTDLSCLEQNKKDLKSYVTLVTCVNELKNRLVIKCIEI